MPLAAHYLSENNRKFRKPKKISYPQPLNEREFNKDKSKQYEIHKLAVT